MTELLRYPFTEQGLTEALSALGTTPAAAVRNLVGMHITGRRGAECECPLAVYLTAVVEGAERAFVYSDDNRSELYLVVQHYTARPDVTALVHDPLATVVRLFDLGRYSELEATDEAA